MKNHITIQVSGKEALDSLFSKTDVATIIMDNRELQNYIKKQIDKYILDVFPEVVKKRVAYLVTERKINDIISDAIQVVGALIVKHINEFDYKTMVKERLEKEAGKAVMNIIKKLGVK